MIRYKRLVQIEVVFLSQFICNINKFTRNKIGYVIGNHK